MVFGFWFLVFWFFVFIVFLFFCFFLILFNDIISDETKDGLIFKRKEQKLILNQSRKYYENKTSKSALFAFLRQLRLKKNRNQVYYKGNVKKMENFFDKLKQFIYNRKCSKDMKEQCFYVRNIFMLTTALKHLNYFKKIRKSFRLVQKNQLRRFSNYWLQRTYFKVSLRNVLHKIFTKFQIRNLFLYFRMWMKNVMIKKYLEKKHNYIKNENKLKAFDIWYSFLTRIYNSKKIFELGRSHYNNKIFKNTMQILKELIYKKYQILNKIEISCVVRDQKLSAVFLKKSFFKVINCIRNSKDRLRKEKFSFKLGNKIMMKKLFLRWYSNIDCDENDGNNDNYDRFNNTSEDLNISSGQKNKRKINCNINEVVDNKNSNKRNKNYLLYKKYKNAKIYNTKNKHSFMLKSWETQIGKQQTHMTILQCRNKYLLFKSIKLFLIFKKKSKNCLKDEKKINLYLCDKKKKLFFRFLLKLIRKKHKKVKEDRIYAVKYYENKLNLGLEKLNKYFITNWTESQKIRLSKIYYRKFIFRKVIRKLSNFVEHSKRVS